MRKFKNKLIHNDEFDIKGSRCYNVLVLINHHLGLKMSSSLIMSSMNV